MINIIVDSNVIYDYVGERYPFYDYAIALLSLGIDKKVNINVCASTISNGFYIFRKDNPRSVKMVFEAIMNYFTVLPLDEEVLRQGVASKFNDIEDAFIHFSATTHGKNITYLVTRNQKDFKESNLQVVSPAEMLDKLIN